MLAVLNRSSSQALGAGVTGVKDIRDHLFFASMAWETLEQIRVSPPLVPEKAVEKEEVKYDDLAAMMRAYEKERWLRETVNPDLDQRFFGSWDLVSKEAQRIEFGLANQMEQYETNMKVRKLLGASGSDSPVKQLSQSIKGAASAVLGQVSLGLSAATRSRSLRRSPAGMPGRGEAQFRSGCSTRSVEWSFE